MVRVLIEINKELKDYAIIELQGVLENDGLSSLEGVKIGDLHYDNKGTPNIIVGHHLLVGKVMKLEKPFAVLKKREDGDDAMDDGTNNSDSTKYDIHAFVSQKIVFKNRPRPIITNTVPIRR